MAALDDLYTIAAAFLDSATDALALTDEGPPARAFVSPGEPALDCCPQLAVWTQNLIDGAMLQEPTGLGAARKINRGGLPVVTIFVQAVRCAPMIEDTGGKIKLPDPDELSAAARAIDQDGWALWNHISWDLRHGDLANVCAGAWRDGGTKLQPQGGCAGWTFIFRYPVEGGQFGT